MIQKTNARHTSTSAAPISVPITSEPEHWGSWSGHKYYSLEVVQNPIRARMCGFGDKDRRPLAPAAVCKMIIKREDNSNVDEDEIDVSFFLVTVDLWSEDGKQEINLVLHPSSQDRIMNSYSTQPKSRRRGTSVVTGPSSRPNHHQSPESSHSTPTTSQYSVRPGDSQSSPVAAIVPPQTSQFNTQGYAFPQQSSTSMLEPINFHNSPPYGTPPDTASPTWGYPSQSAQYQRASSAGFSQGLPSIHSFERTSTSGQSTTDSWQNEGNTNMAPSPYRAWPTESAYSAMDTAAPAATSSPAYNNASLDPSMRSSQVSHQGNSWSHNSIPAATDSSPQSRYGQDSFPASASTPQFDGSVYGSPSYAHHTAHASYYPNSNYVHSTPPPPPPPSTSNPLNHRQTYTRTLVGPLSANACRLKDEHRKPGIFFLFQDLSVRTEGTFRLRLRLMNVGASDGGPPRTHTDVSPVLAQAFTEPFMVYSAKRFPGVPDTTALSISFGSQGQKLPLRNRHGKSRKRRRGEESDGSDEEDGDDT